MAGHSRPKDGVASLAYVPAIHVFGALSDVRDGWTRGLIQSYGMEGSVHIVLIKATTAKPIVMRNGIVHRCLP